ncbi:MAG TPA: Mur ligase domain-containing protein [Nitrosospira sp.]|nr:Mur ligase domain-containing protein [Nitrosospira sp.]
MLLPDHIHFIGACGRAMSGVMAAVADLGVPVTGSDNENTYGSIRRWLEKKGIIISSGFSSRNLNPVPALVVIGRQHGRGNTEVEYVLEKRIPYLSLPEFLCFYFLNGSRNILVAGSKGKTTTTAMLVKILESAGLTPGYMIGGIPRSGIDPVRLGQSVYVLEADDYSTLWWNDNPKALYYRPEVVVLCNSFSDHPEHHTNDDIRLRHFKALVEQLPQNGLLVLADCRNSTDLDGLIGVARCQVRMVDMADGTGDAILGYKKVEDGVAFKWREAYFFLEVNGYMNARNAVSAAMAAQHLGITPDIAASALFRFAGVSGRMDHALSTEELDVYIDCFGYLPESLAENMAALREMHPRRRHVVVYQLLIVDGIPEAQRPLQISLAEWDEVLIVSYESPSPLLVSAGDDYLADLAATLRESGVDAAFIGSLENGLTVLPNLVKAGDVLFFSVHPRSADLAWRIAQHTSTHENTHHEQYS